jgi:hemoglobin-like flavoprotein
MTSDQVLLVRSSWAAIATHGDELSVRFYDHLFAIDQGAARLFSHVDMSAQRAKLAQMLGAVVHSLDDIDSLLPALAALGKRHTHYGVEDRHFDSVGEALVLALSDVCSDDFTPELRAAWTVAYALIASVMKRALVRGANGIAHEPAHTA